MKAPWWCTLLLIAGCSKPDAAPELIMREFPTPPRVDPTVAEVELPPVFDGGIRDVDGGLCCAVRFTLPVVEGETMAQLLFKGRTYDMTRSGGAWSTVACVAPVNDVYYFQTGYPTDDDAGVLWLERVNSAVPVSLFSSVAPEVNIFTGADGGVCEGLDTGPYGQGSDGGSMVVSDGGIAMDAGSQVDAGSAPADAGTVGGYVETSITGDCDVLTSPTVLLSAVNQSPDVDEASTSVLVLPFAFTWYGTAVTHYAANSNGTLQLFTSAAGVPDFFAGNVPLPDPSTPNALIAPFWTDLTAAPMGTTTLSMQSFTGATPHVTVAWNNWTPFFGTQAARMTFQVKLLGGSNAVEFHYCALTANGDSATFEQGFGATVGIESLDGTQGVLHSHKEAVLTTALGIHYQ